MKKDNVNKKTDIYYLGTYRTERIADRFPLGSNAEDAKMSYIASSVKSCGKHVTIISSVSGAKQGYHKKQVFEIDSLETQVYLGSFDTTKKGISKFAALYRLVMLTFYLIFTVKRKDILILYHTQLFSLPVRIAKKLIHFRKILEIEEIFSKDSRNPKDIRRDAMEQKLIESADSFLCASDLLKKYVAKGKQALVIYGSYVVPEIKTDRFDDGKIHIVYAGGVDSLRCVNYIVDSFAYLPDRYRLHILGFGSKNAIADLIILINKQNNLLGREFIEFHGELHGKEYDKLLQKCHIGINLQKIGESIEEYAFPSKISSYLGHGLNVVSGRLKSIEQSSLNNYVTYYNHNSPKDIADAILNVPLKDSEEQKKIIKNLDKDFKNEFFKFLQ